MPKKDTKEKETKETSEKATEEKKSPKKTASPKRKSKKPPPPKRDYTIAKDLPKRLQPETQKRTAKKVERFDIVEEKSRLPKEVVIKKGKGTKFENIDPIAAQIKKRAKSDDLLQTLHTIVYGKASKDTDVKENLSKFSGLVYEDDEKGRKALENKLNGYMLRPLRAIAALLGQDPEGDREEIVERIANFLEKPKDFEKTYPIPGEKKKRKRSSSRSKSPRSKSPRKKKQKKDKNAPKRPRSAYILFCSDKRDEVKKKYPDESITDIAKRLGKLWGKTSDSDKKKFEKEAEKDKERYEKEMKKYEKSKK